MCSFGFSFLVCCVLEVLALADFVREFAEIWTIWNFWKSFRCSGKFLWIFDHSNNRKQQNPLRFYHLNKRHLLTSNSDTENARWLKRKSPEFPRWFSYQQNAAYLQTFAQINDESKRKRDRNTNKDRKTRTRSHENESWCERPELNMVADSLGSFFDCFKIILTSFKNPWSDELGNFWLPSLVSPAQYQLCKFKAISGFPCDN
jgi:hypothetical protein